MICYHFSRELDREQFSPYILVGLSNQPRRIALPANQRTSQINSSRLLREIWLCQKISRIEISQRLGLDKSTVTVLVNKMFERGILESCSEGESTARGGRKPQYLRLHRDYGYYLGLELQPDRIKLIVLDLMGGIREKKSLPYKHNKEDQLQGIIAAASKIYKDLSLSRPILGLGLAMSGIIDPYEGRVVKSMLFNIDSPLLLVRELQKVIPCNIMIENDANACAWGELLEARQNSLMNILFILIESDFLTGESFSSNRFSLGMGLAFDGKVYHGRDFSSGEYRSPQWVSDKSSQFSLTLNELSRLSHDSLVRKRLFNEISQNIAFIINTLNINQVFAGGDITPFWKELKPRLESEIQRNWSYSDRVDCSCSLSSHGDYAAPFGAAAMHLERVFTTGHAPFFQDHGFIIGLEALEKDSEAVKYIN